MTERLNLPVLPLRETVVFPGVAVPISAGRAGTIEAAQAALKGDRRMFAVCQKDNVDEVSPDILYDVGVVVRVVQAQRGRGGLQLMIQGEARGVAGEYSAAGEAMLEADVETVEEGEEPLPDSGFQALHRELRRRAIELARRRGMPEDALSQLSEGVDLPGPFADLVAFYLDSSSQDKQALLETFDSTERLRAVLVQVERELVRLEAQEEIQQKVQEELGEKQREMVLREQMRAIQRELNEGEEGDELEDLRRRIEGLELPPDSRKEIERELTRLERMHPQSAEHQVLRSYLEWITELPWGERTDDRIDLETAERVLEEDHYGLEDVKERVLEFLAVRKLQVDRAAAAADEDEMEAGDVESDAAGEEAPDSAGPDPVDVAADQGAEAAEEGEAGEDDEAQGTGSGTEIAMEADDHERDLEEDHDVTDPAEEPVRATAVGRGPILLFAGPPGVGKTSIAQSIARALGRKYVRISLGGVRDEADIRGHRRTYVGAMAGRIMQGLKQAGTKNPVFLLDEVDKLGVSYQGDPSSALLEVLDPAQNHTFVDHYLGVPFDLSEVLFVATANWQERVPQPLMDRMELVEFGGYTEQEKLEIAKRYLLPRQRKESGLAEGELEVTDSVIQRIISEYTREAGVRQLERELGGLARKAARKAASGAAEPITVTEDDIEKLLGRPKIHPERAAVEDKVGVATGMYYTQTGGDIMFVEASVSPGKDDLILTGQLGDVMKESARAALTYARTHHQRLGIPADRLKGLEIHIHVPAGATPKDGPSAGVTIAASLVSALSRRPVRHDVAMTGELTLTGRVLPIGGVKEKILGAHRAGIREVILPKDNEADLEKLPADVREELIFHPVANLGEALAVALRGASLEEGVLCFSEPSLPTTAGHLGATGEAMDQDADRWPGGLVT